MSLKRIVHIRVDSHMRVHSHYPTTSSNPSVPSSLRISFTTAASHAFGWPEYTCNDPVLFRVLGLMGFRGHSIIT